MPPDPAPQAPRPVRFTEPTEGAFTLVVPEGWAVEAGVVRAGGDARPWYRVQSPGGGAELRGGDPRVPLAFVAPGGFGMGFGMPLPMPAQPYVPPVAFAEGYARDFARERGAATFEPQGTRDVEAMLAGDTRPDARGKVQFLAQNGAAFGGVVFACSDRGLRGLVDVITLRTQMPFGFVWSPILTALVGPADAWPAVEATLLQIARSYATNPLWQQGHQQQMRQQHQMAMDTIHTGTRISQMQHQSGMEAIHHAGYRAQVSAQTNAEIGDLQMQGWHQQQASSDEMQRRRVNGVNETADLYDPTTGDVYRGAPAGFQTYWTDGLGRVVASEGYDNPDGTRFNQATDLDDLNGPGPSGF